MINYSEYQLLSPETIWLETEDYQRANELSNSLSTENQSWQEYLNLLALFGLKSWFNERLSQKKIAYKINSESQSYYLQVGDFTISAIAVTNVLSETINLTSAQLQDSITHFYAILEIDEEAESAIFRGLLRRDTLDSYLENQDISHFNRNYSLPLSWFDPEPNHLLSYCQHLTADAITLPIESPKPTKLSQWLQDTLIEGWTVIENLINPEMNLALSTRNIAEEYKQGKLIQLGEIRLVLAIAIIPEVDEKLSVRVQLYPTESRQLLPEGVSLSLLSNTGKNLQSVEARDRDNFIQLRNFKGKQGKCFSIEIALNSDRVIEDFEL